MIHPALISLRNKLMQAVSRASEALNARSIREKMMILSFALLGVLAVNYWLWLSPVISALSEGLPQKSHLEAQIAELRDVEKTKKQVIQKHEMLVNKIAGLERELVSSDQIPVFLENLSKVARASGVKITSLSPLDLAARPQGKIYSAVPIQILATAGTHPIGRLLDELEGGKTLIKITNVKITADPKGGVEHIVELVLEAYRPTEVPIA